MSGIPRFDLIRVNRGTRFRYYYDFPPRKRRVASLREPFSLYNPVRKGFANNILSLGLFFLGESVRKLDIGCGQAKEPGAFGLDINTATHADALADVSRSPLPVRPNSFDRIFIRHIIEHVDDPLRFMEELHRAACNGGEIEGVTPHFSNPCSFADPTHKHHFSILFLNFFREEEDEGRTNGWRRWANRFLECYYPAITFYTQARFEIIERRITFCRLHRWLGISWFANRFPEVWEFHLSGIFRARDIIFRLRVLK